MKAPSYVVHELPHGVLYKMLADAWDDGYIAADNGKSETENPFREQSAHTR